MSKLDPNYACQVIIDSQWKSICGEPRMEGWENIPYCKEHYKRKYGDR